MGKPRFPLWKLMLFAMIFVPISALLIVAGYDLFTMFASGGDLLAGIIILAVQLALPCGMVALFIFAVVLASRDDPPPLSDSNRDSGRFQFKIHSFLIVVLVVALVLGMGLWIARNS